MKNTREGYEFPRGPKIKFREAANGHCQFPGEECPNPNNGAVHHLTGIFEARLNLMKPARIKDLEQNALMLCDYHAFRHDEQEALHILILGKEYAPEHEIYNNVGEARRRGDLIVIERHRAKQAIDEAIASIKKEPEEQTA
jgi:hypothetical protein